jgi:putative sigma-54 modulation protein
VGGTLKRRVGRETLTVQVNISTRHGHLSQDTQDKITAKAERLSRFYDRVTGIGVTVDLEHKEEARVEVRVTAERADDFVASHGDTSVMAALDVVLDKLEQQLRKHKEKRIDLHRGARRQELARGGAEPDELAEGGFAAD